MTQTGMVAGGRLTDWISLGVLASAVPRDAVDEAIEATGKAAKRAGGKLPPHVMVYFAMALALFADDGYEEVAARLAGTLRTGIARIAAARNPGIDIPNVPPPRRAARTKIGGRQLHPQARHQPCIVHRQLGHPAVLPGG